MNEDEAWALFTGRVMDEDKVSPEMRSGKKLGEKMTEEQAFSALSARLGHAREKHPHFAGNAWEAYLVIADEVLELRHAVGKNGEPPNESRERQIDEALDVAATAMRFVMGEHDAR